MTLSLKFRHKVLLAASLIIVSAFALFTLYNDSLQKKTLTQQLTDRLAEAAEAAAGNIQNWMSGRILLIQNLGDTLVIETAPGSRDQALASDTLLSTFMNVYVGSDFGEFTMQPKNELPANYDPRTRPWYKRATETGKTSLTEPYLDAITKRLTITVATPISRSGYRGVAGGDLNLETLVQMIGSLRYQKVGQAFLVDGKGKILVHSDNTQIMKTLGELYPNNTPVMTSGIHETTFDGRAQAVTFARVKGLPSVDWYVGVAVDEADVFATLSEFRESALIATTIGVVLVIVLLGVLLNVLLRPLNRMSDAMHGMAAGHGDLTQRLNIPSQDEFGYLGEGFNLFVKRIHSSMQEVSFATTALNEVALQVVSASNSSMLNCDQQANCSNSVAIAINQLGESANEIAQSAARTAGYSTQARHLSSESQTVVEQNLKSMQHLSAQMKSASEKVALLNSKTANIGQILEVITGISRQTNLLALNAAIEAARAGDAGRGFAVVADEVRSLSHRTQQSASQVQRIIEELQAEAQEAVDIMIQGQSKSEKSVRIASETGSALESVATHIGEIDSMNQSVAAATEEQSSVVHAINAQIFHMNSLNQKGLQNLQTTLHACADLERQAIRLNQMVANFQL